MLLKRNPLSICLFAAAAALMLERAAIAVVVLKKGIETPLMGHLVRADDRAVVVRQELSDGKTRDVTIARSDIDELIETVSAERLAELGPAQPAVYFEYAEELAEKRRDPEARDTARRLLTIAAHIGDADLRQSSLLGLADLARTGDDRRRLEALVYLNDPQHHASLLARASGSSQQVDGSARADLLAALRLIRQGQAAAAKALFEKPAVAAQIARGDAVIRPADLAALAAQRTLTDEQLARILRAELSLEADSSRWTAGGEVRWSEAAVSSLAPVPPLTLERLTEFDPAESVFRQGKWQRP